ncbi:MAG: hypothetical protein ACR2PX_26740 [Endozoicomonas sp.]|uniref:hypothetical protein n=1 Tax=Endozoicomonas sp. TaxID=1892382 RepID=UPI003D9BB75F
MLRPDHEIEAAADWIDSWDIEQREQKLRALPGLNILRDIVSSHWLLSINTNPKGMPVDGNEHIQPMIDHPKFKTIPSFLGALGVMEQVLQPY